MSPDEEEFVEIIPGSFTTGGWCETCGRASRVKAGLYTLDEQDGGVLLVGSIDICTDHELEVPE